MAIYLTKIDAVLIKARNLETSIGDKLDYDVTLPVYVKCMRQVPDTAEFTLVSYGTAIKKYVGKA